MTNYKNIFGKPVKFLTTDPDNAETEGQIWYNSTADAFKSVLVSEAWSSGAPTINLSAHGAGAGTTTAGLTFGGRNPPGPNFVSTTEEYNGSGWSAGGPLSTARSYLAGFGTQTDAVAAGGRIDAPGTSTNATEEYDGSSWTAGGNMGTGRRVGGSAGTTGSAGLAIGGPGITATEEYNGSAWTAGGSLNTSRFYLGGFGTQTSAVAAGGNGGDSAVEEYDGSSWTTVNSLNNGRTQLGSSGSSQTSGLVFGGEGPPYPTQKANTESYDGTTWTETVDLATARRELSGSGGNSGTSAIAVDGFPTYNLTEEYNRSTNVITGAAWASAANMNTARGLLASAGTTQNAQLGAGGYSPPAPSNNTWANVEEYNGTSWSEVNDIPAIKSRFAGVGSQTSAATFGGFTPLGPNTNYATTEEYDGTNWTSGGSLNTARCYMSGFGIQTAAVCAGGATLNPDVGFNKTEEYNGTSWSEVSDMPNFFRNQGGVGVLTAGVITGGKEGPSSSFPGIVNTTTTLEYDGTNWTSGGTSLIPDGNVTGGGTQSVAWFAGYQVPLGNISTHYNGTSFVTSASCAESHSAGGGGAPQTSGIIFGDAAEYNNKTEEFTPESSALNLKTLTTS